MLNRKRFLWLALAAGAAGLFVSPFLVPREHAAGPAQSAASGAAKALEALKLNNLGIAYMDQQRPQDALKCFQEASAAEPKNYIPRLNQGIALLNTQRSDDARAILTEAAKSQPNDAHIWYNLGLLEKSVGNPEAAVANFEKVAAIDPGDADTHYFMGLLNSQLHQYPKAIEEFQKAVAINAFHLSAEFGMAQAYQRSGDTANAKIHLERFQHLNSQQAWRADELNLWRARQIFARGSDFFTRDGADCGDSGFICHPDSRMKPRGCRLRAAPALRRARLPTLACVFLISTATECRTFS